MRARLSSGSDWTGGAFDGKNVRNLERRESDMEFSHTSVLLEETIASLLVRPDGIYPLREY